LVQQKLSRDVGDTLPDDGECTALLCTVDRVAGVAFASTAYNAWRCVRRDALLPHQLCEVCAPGAQHDFVDVKALAVLALGCDDDMDVVMLLVVVKHHGVSVLEGEFPASELSGDRCCIHSAPSS
jgi:hypothetical protein